MLSFRDTLAAFWLQYKDAMTDGKISLPEGLRLAASGARVVEALCDGLADGNPATFDKFQADIEWLVDTYVVKQDMPFLNDFVENMLVDPQLVPATRAAMVYLRDYLTQQSTTPAPTTTTPDFNTGTARRIG